MGSKLRSKFTLLFIAFAVAMFIFPATAFAEVISTDGTTASSTPTIQSDKADYPPGATVTLTGSNWQPGESVHIYVNDSEGQTWDRNADVTADQSGNVTDQFNLPDWFVATYKVTATGAQSGVATTTFTDGNMDAKANLPAGATTTVQWVKYSTANNCTGNTSTSGTATLSGTTAVTLDGANANQSIKMTANATSSDSKAFQNWTSNGTITVTSDGGRTACVQGKTGSSVTDPANTVTSTANYGAAATSLSVNAASGTYGGTTSLSATLTKTSGGAAVSGKNISFTLNGNSVGNAMTDASGVATLTNASLSGINANTYANGVSASFAGDSGFSASNGSNSLTVSPKQVTGSFTAANKTYDGTTAASITGRSLSGAVSGDDVSLVGGTATFGDKNVGTGKTVTGTGFTLSGTKAGNYTLASSTLTTTANITKRDLTVSATGQNKVYDGNNSATVTLSSDKVAGDALTLSYTSATFANEDVGTGKTVTVNGISVSGADAGNYNLTNTSASATANITVKTVTGSFTAANKVYDGTTAATITGRSLSGVIGTDAVSLTGGTATFADKEVGTGKTVTGTGFSLSGTKAGNYTLASSTLTTTANITAWTAQGTGFYAPVGIDNSEFVAAPGLPPALNNTDVWNTVKGGSTVPLKFNVYAGTVEKTSLSDIQPFTANKLASCSAAGTIDDPLDYFLTTGATTLRYDTSQWIQNWQTPKVTNDTCYRTTVKFADGSSISAFFKLRK